MSRGRQTLEIKLEALPDDDDDLSAEEQENLEESLIDEATAAQTVAELQAEIEILAKLEEQAQAEVASGLDRKWTNFPKSCKTTRKCAMQEVASAS